jgi:hypothetical protein
MAGRIRMKITTQAHSTWAWADFVLVCKLELLGKWRIFVDLWNWTRLMDVWTGFPYSIPFAPASHPVSHHYKTIINIDMVRKLFTLKSVYEWMMYGVYKGSCCEWILIRFAFVLKIHANQYHIYQTAYLSAYGVWQNILSVVYPKA